MLFTMCKRRNLLEDRLKPMLERIENRRERPELRHGQPTREYAPKRKHTQGDRHARRRLVNMCLGVLIRPALTIKCHEHQPPHIKGSHRGCCETYYIHG